MPSLRGSLCSTGVYVLKMLYCSLRLKAGTRSGEQIIVAESRTPLGAGIHLSRIIYIYHATLYLMCTISRSTANFMRITRNAP